MPLVFITSVNINSGPLFEVLTGQPVYRFLMGTMLFSRYDTVSDVEQVNTTYRVNTALHHFMRRVILPPPSSRLPVGRFTSLMLMSHRDIAQETSTLLRGWRISPAITISQYTRLTRTRSWFRRAVICSLGPPLNTSMPHTESEATSRADDIFT